MGMFKHTVVLLSDHLTYGHDQILCEKMLAILKFDNKTISAASGRYV